MSQPGNTPGIVIDVRFVNYRHHLAALRDCLPSLAMLLVAGVMLMLGLFVVDLTPYTPPMYPKEVGLSIGAAVAIIIMSVTIVARYRQHLAASRRRG